MEIFEIKNLYEKINDRLNNLKNYLDIENKKFRLDEVNKIFETPEIWNDQERVKNLSKEKSKLLNVVKMYQNALDKRDDFDLYQEMYNEDESEEIFKELKTSVVELKKIVAEIEFKMMLSGEADYNNAIISINSGSGGTESQDWVSMLNRMIQMYCEKQGFSITQLDFHPGEEAGKGGIKSITFLVKGEYAYGLLKSENGVHRLVRISPFDSSSRRHTTFASISVAPEIDDDIEIEVKDEDIRVDTFRASGAGGQHVNKTDSAIRITHYPTGVVVSCQNERSQHKNRETALKILKSKLYELELEKKKEEEAKFHANKKEISWGAQIRSYVLHPYKMVKDHRTNVETGNTSSVLDGNLEQFVKAYLLEFSG